MQLKVGPGEGRFSFLVFLAASGMSAFFGWLAVLLALASLASGWAPVDDYIRTGFVDHLPRAVLAAGLFILSALSMSLGVLLSSINRRSTELASLIRKRSR